VDLEERAKLLNSLNKMMTERADMQARLDASLKEFSSRLFNALEQVLSEMAAAGIPGVGKTRRLVHPAGKGHEGLQVFIEDWSIIFVPLSGFARPNPVDEARIPPYQFKELCARIAVFLTDDPAGQAFYDFILFQDRSWFAWGYGWPKQQSDIESTNFEALALELVESFIKDIYVTWHVREDTSLAQVLDVKQRAYSYGLPGEETR
jgi:hypothetical protein